MGVKGLRMKVILQFPRVQKKVEFQLVLVSSTAVALKFCLPWAGLRLLFLKLAQANDLMAMHSPCPLGK